MDGEENVQWLRWYYGTRHNRKYRSLTPDGRCLFSALLELAGEIGQNGWVWVTPDRPMTTADYAEESHLPIESIRPALTDMTHLGLIEESERGLFIPKYAERQFKSDTSTQRTRAYRKRMEESNVTGTSLNRHCDAPDTDTETDHKYTPSFDVFWSVFPRKVGKRVAFEKWAALVKQKVLVDSVITAAKEYAKSREGENQEYTLHPKTFLSKDRWKDYLPTLTQTKPAQPLAEPEHARLLREMREAEQIQRNHSAV